MMEESQPQGKGVCWTLRLWSVAVTSILLLSTCFIMSCVVTYRFTMDKPSRRLSELHTNHSNLTGFSEGTMVSVYFQKCSQLLEEKKSTKDLTHDELNCIKNNRSLGDKVWSCCPKNWQPFGSNCYFISPDSASWSESEETCSSMGAHLAVIHSWEEQDFITGILPSRAAYFIGLRDEGHRQWRWVDGTPYNENAIFWHRDEPNNDNEQCATLNYPSGRWGWNDDFCNNNQRSVCQLKRIYL